MEKPIAVTFPAEVAAKIQALKPDGSVRANALTVIDRYFDIVKVGRREVRKAFSDAELNLLADICNGTIFEPYALLLENNAMAIQLEDTIEYYGDSYAEKWDVDQVNILAQLKLLSKIGQVALFDLIERFWSVDETDIGKMFQV